MRLRLGRAVTRQPSVEVTIMHVRWIVLLLPLLFAACADGGGASGRCLYAVEMEYGQMMKWGSCTSPPANAIRRLDDGS